MRVLYVAAEAAPLIKFGGLGDVAGSLPLALKRLGVDVRVAMPWFKDIDVPKSGIRESGGVGETRLGESDVPVYLLSKDEFYMSKNQILRLRTRHEERWYATFCGKLMDFIKQWEWKPQIFHGNDWQVADALVSLEQTSTEDLRIWGYTEKNFSTILTLHNLSYHSSFLRKAILSADVINAVSPSYAKEILTKEFCFGLCEDLNQRKDDLYGILNGIDYSVWEPQSDELLPIQFGRDSWRDGKLRNKKALRKKLGLVESEGLLLGFVGRLDPHQKGVLVLANAIEKLVGLGSQVVVLGSGSRRAERELKEAAANNSGMAVTAIKYDEALAHEIYAGADALIIPSRFEPCGLIQMIAMKYGSLPIARAVGGLKDTIEDGKTGFLYRDYYSRGLVRAVKRAQSLFLEEPQRWGRMVDEAMKKDFSWDRSAKEYLELYKKALDKSSK